jgi:hypothetical protein
MDIRTAEGEKAPDGSVDCGGMGRRPGVDVCEREGPSLSDEVLARREDEGVLVEGSRDCGISLGVD